MIVMRARQLWRALRCDTQPAEVDAAYREVELIGDIAGTLRRLLAERAAVQPRGIRGRRATQRHEAREIPVQTDLRTSLLADLHG